MSEESKAIRIISFDDKKKNYRTWAKKFKTAATLRGYNIVLTEADPKVPRQSKVLKDTDKELLRLRKANDKAYCELILACHGDISFGIVEKSVTKDLPEGDANLAWKALKRRFDPKTSSSKLKLKKQFTNSSLTDWKKDPADWIMELEKIRTQLSGMKHVISDEDFMIHILANLPDEYESKVESLENDLDNEDDPLTLDRMSIELDAKYEKICKKNDYDPENEKDKKKKKRNENNGTALAAAGNGQFKGRCFVCGNWGHKSHQCPNRNNNTQNGQTTQNVPTSNANPTANNTNNYVPPRRPRVQVKCDHCGKWGHRKEDCWFLKNNQFRNAEKANVCMPVSEDVPNGVEDEVVLINEMPTIKNEETGLNEIRNNIWIADSGASSHMTNDASGLYNTREISSKVKIGSGDYVEAELIGSLRGIAKQKNGKETPITLTNVKYVPQLFCNLISLTSVLNKGFK